MIQFDAQNGHVQITNRAGKVLHDLPPQQANLPVVSQVANTSVAEMRVAEITAVALEADHKRHWAESDCRQWRERAERAESQLAKLTQRIKRLDHRLHTKAMELHGAAIDAGADESLEGSIWESAWGDVHGLLEE